LSPVGACEFGTVILQNEPHTRYPMTNKFYSLNCWYVRMQIEYCVKL